MLKEAQFCGFKFLGTILYFWWRMTKCILWTWYMWWEFWFQWGKMECFSVESCVRGLPHLVLAYLATWAVFSAVNERYWPRFFGRVSAIFTFLFTFLITTHRAAWKRNPVDQRHHQRSANSEKKNVTGPHFSACRQHCSVGGEFLGGNISWYLG